MAKKAREDEVLKATPDEIAAYEKQMIAQSGYELADPDAAYVSHGGEIYTVVNGRLICPPDIAHQLIKAGVLKG